jgi:hypothetical protein
MSERTVTLKDALAITARKLGEIKIPVSLYDEIGAPIKQAISTLNLCVKAAEEVEKEPEPEEPATEEEN